MDRSTSRLGFVLSRLAIVIGGVLLIVDGARATGPERVIEIVAGAALLGGFGWEAASGWLARRRARRP